MARMIQLDPVPKQGLPCDGWEAIATEAGRYATGLRATIQVWNSELRTVRQLALADPDSWTDFVSEISTLIDTAPDPVVQALRTLAGGVEGVLRQMEAHGKGRGASQATQLVDLIADEELFHSRDSDGFITIAVDAHRETWPLRAKAFRRWLARRFYVEHNKSPGSQALQDALNVLEGNAVHEGPEYPVCTRLGEHQGNIYLDLANDRWEAIEISSTGWRVVANPLVKFRRTRGMLPLPYPMGGGMIEDLRKFLNVGDDGSWILLQAWLGQALRPSGPYPVLVLHGEQGAAKSTTARMLRALIDPNSAPLRAEPRDGRDLMIAAMNGWLISLDNLSHLSPWLSDALCRLATGGGFSTRELYSDADETIFDAQRPVVLNGIEELATRGDLLDRCMILYLPSIPEHERKPEADLWRDFEAKRPAILGALLDAVSEALRSLETVKLERLPRMADFALWAAAAAPKLGYTQEEFLDAYAANRRAANELALDAALIVPPLRDLLAERGGAWRGTATSLLLDLAEHVDERTRKAPGWPTNGRAVSNALRRIAPNLRAVRVEVVFAREGKNRSRTIILEQADKSSSALSAAEENQMVWGTQTERDLNSGNLGQADGADAADAKKHINSYKQRKPWPYPRRP
jgi:hypothetical protein